MGIVAKNIIVGGGGTVIESSAPQPVTTLESLRQKAQNNKIKKTAEVVQETSVEDDVIQHVKRSSYLLDMVAYNDE